jgi:hypothetical protein
MNYVMIRRDGLTTTGSKDTFRELVKEIAWNLCSSFHNPVYSPVKMIVVSVDPSVNLMTYTAEEIYATHRELFGDQPIILIPGSVPVTEHDPLNKKPKAKSYSERIARAGRGSKQQGKG